MKMPPSIPKEMLAPCGVNCQACSAHLAATGAASRCPGCRAPANTHKRKSCVNCAKKDCAFSQGLTWCFECSRFPCSRIKSLNKRYIENYGIDLIQNGRSAQAGMDAFLQEQRKRFTCPHCGGAVGQHKKLCSECGKATE
ncbi:MAG: DUF3795 domain-containing protein [Christensenellaceae bacterium]|jgi:hypothetical protein